MSSILRLLLGIEKRNKSNPSKSCQPGNGRTLTNPKSRYEVGLNRTSRPVPVVREFSNVPIPDFRFFSFPDSGHLSLLKFKKSPRFSFSFSRWSLMAWFLNPFLAVIFALSLKMGVCKNVLKRFSPLYREFKLALSYFKLFIFLG